MIQAGLTPAQSKGVPLGYDYEAANAYWDLNNPARSVQHIFDNLKRFYGWTGGDHHTNQAPSQVYAGLGWWSGGETDYGVEDWGYSGFGNSGVACERAP